MAFATYANARSYIWTACIALQTAVCKLQHIHNVHIYEWSSVNERHISCSPYIRRTACIYSGHNTCLYIMWWNVQGCFFIRMIIRKLHTCPCCFHAQTVLGRCATFAWCPYICTNVCKYNEDLPEFLIYKWPFVYEVRMIVRMYYEVIHDVFTYERALVIIHTYHALRDVIIGWHIYPWCPYMEFFDSEWLI